MDTPPAPTGFSVTPTDLDVSTCGKKHPTQDKHRQVLLALPKRLWSLGPVHHKYGRPRRLPSITAEKREPGVPGVWALLISSEGNPAKREFPLILAFTDHLWEAGKKSKDGQVTSFCL